MSDQQKCRWCDQPAAYLCDFVLERNGRLSDVTCDAPMCEAHRKQVSSGLMCSRGRGKGHGCHPFSIDYCPGHAAWAAVGR